jgi:hypothetical protein
MRTSNREFLGHSGQFWQCYFCRSTICRQENGKKLDREESFASFTEIKLNKLYNKSNDIQNQLQSLEKRDQIKKLERFAEIMKRRK